jgi:hypothetical protein
MLPPESRVWNAHGDEDGTISLFDEPKGSRLPLPEAPPYRMLDGYVIPYGKNGEPLADLKLTEVAGTCERGTGNPVDDPPSYPDRYPERCWWKSLGSYDCFKQPGRVELGDVVLCPDAYWEKAYDPLHFFRVTVTELI